MKKTAFTHQLRWKHQKTVEEEMVKYMEQEED